MTAAFKKSNLKKAQKILVKEEKLCYDIRVVGMNMSEAGLSEWQTRWTQNPLMATSCGFKSRGRHSLAGAKPLNPKHLGFSGFSFVDFRLLIRPKFFVFQK